MKLSVQITDDFLMIKNIYPITSLYQFLHKLMVMNVLGNSNLSEFECIVTYLTLRS